MLEHETTVALADLLTAARGLKDEGYRLITCTGVQTGADVTVIYHFDRDYQLRHLRLQVAPGETIPSVSPVFSGAFLAENELQDFFGLKVSGLPIDYHGRLFLAEDAPVSPMLKVVKRDGAEEGEPDAR